MSSVPQIEDYQIPTEAEAGELAKKSWRPDGLGGSDAAAALGKSRFQSRYSLWAEKTGLIAPDDLSKNEAVVMGQVLEPVVALMYARRTGREIRRHRQTIFHDRYRFLYSHIDRWAKDQTLPDRGVLECKTGNAFQDQEWEKEGPPIEYLIQLQDYLHITGKPWGSIAVLIGGQKFRFWDYDRNDRFCKEMEKELVEFWRMVEAKEPPEVDGSDSCAEALYKLYPQHREGKVITLPEEAIELTNRLRAIDDSLDALNEERSSLRNQMKAWIGEAEKGVLPDRSAAWNWKLQHREGYFVQPSDSRVLRRVKAPKVA